jgi:hypothetical protein
LEQQSSFDKIESAKPSDGTHTAKITVSPSPASTRVTGAKVTPISSNFNMTIQNLKKPKKGFNYTQLPLP